MKFKFIIALLSIIVCFSCKRENMCDCVKSTGKTNTIYHNKSNFNCIDISDKIDLYLTQGANFSVSVEAGANLQKLIKTELEGETLKVYNTNRCNWVRGYKHKIKIYITAPRFSKILHNGIGTIKNTNVIIQDSIDIKSSSSGNIELELDVKKIKCRAKGNGDIYLYGKTDNLEHHLTGTNYLYGYGLIITNYVNLRSGSIGKAFLNAPENGLMDVMIEKTGNVYYKGNPTTINLIKKDKGELIKE